MLVSQRLLWALLLLSSAALHAETIVPPGPVSGTWTQSGSPYLIQGEITILADSTLIIQPGVAVIFQGHYKFIINGYLEALGTETDSILFTAADTTIGWHGIRFIDAPDSSRLLFCIIQYGKALGSYPDPDANGGGIYCDHSNPVISCCNISWNQAEAGGGGLYCHDSCPLIVDCAIGDNLGWPGGILCEESSPSIVDCIISGNRYTGIYCEYGSNAIISRCTVSHNEDYGIRCFFSSPTIDSCVISDNWEFVGGGIHCDSLSNPIISNSIIRGNTGGSGDANGGIVCRHNSNPLISHCTIADNTGYPAAGGVNSLSGSRPTLSYCLITGNLGSVGAIIYESSSGANIDHCTISGNSGFVGAGIYCWDDSGTVISNTIVEGNTGNGGIRFLSSVNPSVRYCDVNNNENGNLVGEIPPGLGEITITNLNGDSCDAFFNIFLDPLFVDPTIGDYHLQSTSPCIDAGDPNSPRDPDSTIADIGAFYFHQSGIGENRPDHSIPTSFRLYQNYPNPFNSSTTITLSVPMTSYVSLGVYDIIGRHVATLINNQLSPGIHRITFDGSDLPSGTYFLKMETQGVTEVRKAILLK